MNQQAPKDPQKQGGCFPTVFLMIGFGLLLVAIVSVLSATFGWELALSTYGSSTEIPHDWDAAIALLVTSLIWIGIGWLIGTDRFLGFWRKSALNKVIVLGTVVAVLVGAFLILDDYDRRLREAAQSDTFGQDLPPDEGTPDEKPEPPNPYADREVDLVVTNPSLDTLKAYLEGELLLSAAPREFGKADLAPGTHRIALLTGKDSLGKYTLEVPKGKRADKNLIMVLNPGGHYNVAVLNFQDYYDGEHMKRKEAKTINYLLEAYEVGQEQFSVNVDGGSPLLPRRASLDIGYGTALKFVAVPQQIGEDRSLAFDYAIWSFVDDEKRGIMQNDLNFYMLSDAEKRKVVKNRLDEDYKRFLAESPAN